MGRGIVLSLSASKMVNSNMLLADKNKTTSLSVDEHAAIPLQIPDESDLSGWPDGCRDIRKQLSGHKKNASTRQRAVAFKAYVKMNNHFILVLGRKSAAITYGLHDVRVRY